MKCPIENCKDGKRIQKLTTIDGRTGKKTISTYEIECSCCHGMGVVSKTRIKEYREQVEYSKSLWCSCKEQGDPIYYEYKDGSHGYDCSKCGKLLQTG